MKKLLLFFLASQFYLLAQVPSLLKDITPGTAASNVSFFTALPNNDILFTVNSTTVGIDGTWFSDGSTAGTRLFNLNGKLWSTNVNAGTNTTNSLVAIDFNGKKYGSCKTSGYRLWRTDGTTNGTDSLPTGNLVGVTFWTISGGLLYFYGSNAPGTGGSTELWRTDGTAAGTYSIASGLSGINYHAVSSSCIVFYASTTAGGGEPWRTDGTAAGTYMLKDVRPGGASGFTGNNFYLANNKFYFQGNDGIAGDELWVSDGTTTGTSLVKDIYPGTASSGLQNFYSANNGLYFNANDGVSGIRVWFTDGTQANTQMPANIGQGTLTAIPVKMLSNNNDTYYFYSYVSQANSNLVLAVFKTNGTTAGTTTLNLAGATNTNIAIQVFVDKSIHLVNNNLYVIVGRTFNVSLSSYDSIYVYKMDMNLSAASIVFRQPSTVSIPLMMQDFLMLKDYGSKIFFSYTGGTTGASPSQFCVFDAGMNMQKSYPNLLNGLSNIRKLASTNVFGNKLFFPFQNGDVEPGWLDLTNDSIYMIKNIQASGVSIDCPGGPDSFWDCPLYSLNGQNYFTAFETGYGVEFFVTDFTSAGTYRIKDINPGVADFNHGCGNGYYGGFGPSGQGGLVTPINIFFMADDGSSGTELWCFVNSANTTGINENKISKEEIKVFPNPAAQNLSVVSSQEIFQINIVNILGSTVKEIKLKNQTSAEITISDLPNGIYFINISTKNGTETKKFVKE